MKTTTYSHYLVRTAFHGGGVVSMHWTEAGAEKKRTKYRKGLSCTCGCVVVVAANGYAELPRAGEAHYASPARPS